MTTITRTITGPTPEKLRTGDYVTLRRLGRTNSPPVSVRGTVHRWDPIYADWLTLAGWPNQRFAIDGDGAQWTIDRIERSEVVTEGIPFVTGEATVTYPGRRAERRRGVYMAGKFYPLGDHGQAMAVPEAWTDFIADHGVVS
jgi:hypothetical protein